MSLWTYEAAYNALLESVALPPHTIESLDKFLSERSSQLKKCWDPFQKQTSGSGSEVFNSKAKLENGITVSQVDKKLIEDAKQLSDILGIHESESLSVVTKFDRMGILKDEKRQLHYVRLYLSERRYAVKLVMQLFLDRAARVYEAEEYDKLVKKHSAEILVERKFFEELVDYIKHIFTTPMKELDDENLNQLYIKETKMFQLLLLDMLFQSLATVIPTSTPLLAKWIECCDAADYFVQDPKTSALGVLITTGFLDLEQDFSLENANPDSYILDAQCVVKMHNSLSKLASYDLSPALLAYGIVLHRMAIRKEAGDTMLKDAYAKINMDTEPEQLVLKAINLKAIQKIGSLFKDKVLPDSASYATACSSLLQAVLPYVTLNEMVASSIKSCTGILQAISETFFADPFAHKALMIARAKVPEGMKPFLKIAQALGSDAFEYLYSMTTFMQELPRSFRDYEFTPDRPSIVQLTAQLELYPGRRDGAGGIVLQPGATGEIISTGNSTVILWNLKYNGWSFIGRILEQMAIEGGSSGSEEDILIEILTLINETLTRLDEQRGIDLLDSLSEGLRPGTDIVELITKILDESMYTRNISFCVLCVDFLRALTNVVPGKVWPYIGRSKLLERNGRGGQMATILGAVEIVQCKYDFTISIIKLVSTLITDATTMALDNSVSHKIKSEALTKFVRHLVDVYESFAYWRYSEPQQRMEIASLVLETLTEVLYSNYRVDNELTKKVLGDCATVITDQFLNTNEACLRTLQPLLGAIESVARAEYPLDIDNGLRLDELVHTDVSLKFCSLVLRVRSLLRLPISMLEKRLFIHSPDLALIFMRYNALHAPVIDLLDSMISGYCHSEFDQPSLLAHLGTEYSQMLITGLANAVQNELESDTTIGNICNYFSSILVSQQEGLSILLLSGKDTRNTSNKVESVDSLLKVLEERIANKKDLHPALADQILDCISLAHSNWNMSKSVEKPTKLIDAMVSVIDRAYLHHDDSPQQHSEVVYLANIFSTAAKAVKILSIELYKNPKLSISLKDKLLDYSKKFLRIEWFRSSLHRHLTKNFESKYGITLNRFIKSTLLPRKSYGISYMYDMWLLDILLGHDDTWDSGYRTEVIEANVNLSLVDAQISMVHAWSLFITSLVNENNDKSVLKRVAMVGIEINHSSDDAMSLPLFQGVFHRRLDLAFYVLYNCKDSREKLTVDDLTIMFQLLANILTSTGAHKQRQLLKIISLALEEFKAHDFQLQQIVHQILDVVVIKGMRDIIQDIGTGENGCVEDIIQITMILRKSLAIPGIHAVYGNLALQMADSGCDRAVMSLYSNCSELSGGEVYGELALLYLVEWLQVDAMADQFVFSGIFGMLMESPISKIIQQGDVRPNSTRLYATWTNGILTLVLVLLQKLGSRIIPEVLVFINFFQAQIQSALKSWLEPSQVFINLATINETSQLILLFDIVTKLCEADQIAQLSKQSIPANADLVESLDYLLSHQKFLASRVVMDSSELERVVSELEDLRELLLD